MSPHQGPSCPCGHTTPMRRRRQLADQGDHTVVSGERHGYRLTEQVGALWPTESHTPSCAARSAPAGKSRGRIDRHNYSVTPGRRLGNDRISSHPIKAGRPDSGNPPSHNLPAPTVISSCPTRLPWSRTGTHGPLRLLDHDAHSSFRRDMGRRLARGVALRRPPSTAIRRPCARSERGISTAAVDACVDGR